MNGCGGGRQAQAIPTVLLVDDEPEVRRLVGKVLMRNGFSILEAASGVDALRLAERHAGPIDLLLSDVRMPGMDGGDLARRLGPAHPEMRILFMSGQVSQKFLEDSAEITSFFIGKPFTPSALVGKVQDVLASGDRCGEPLAYLEPARLPAQCPACPG